MPGLESTSAPELESVGPATAGGVEVVDEVPVELLLESDVVPKFELEEPCPSLDDAWLELGVAADADSKFKFFKFPCFLANANGTRTDIEKKSAMKAMKMINLVENRKSILF